MFEVTYECDGSYSSCTKYENDESEDCLTWYEFYLADTCGEYFDEPYDCAADYSLESCSITTGYDNCNHIDLCAVDFYHPDQLEQISDWTCDEFDTWVSTYEPWTGCPDGEYDDSTTTDCYTCPAGYYCVGGIAIAPVECPMDYYCEEGVSAPVECPMSSTTAITGASSSVDCDGIESCPEGHYNLENTCTLCATGEYAVESTYGACNTCEQGTYSDVMGAAECTACDEGY